MVGELPRNSLPAVELATVDYRLLIGMWIPTPSNASCIRSIAVVTTGANRRVDRMADRRIAGRDRLLSQHVVAGNIVDTAVCRAPHQSQRRIVEAFEKRTSRLQLRPDKSGGKRLGNSLSR